MKTLLPTDPTHFSVILIGTGLVESILAAALSKAGYTVLHLDQSNTYGDDYASLTLAELVQLPTEHHLDIPSQQLLDQAMKQSSQFSISLSPSILPAIGPGIEVMKRSRVAVYLQFALLGKVAVWEEQEQEGGGGGCLKGIPMSKADIFNDKTMSLVEKRRVSKLLLAAAGSASAEESGENDGFGIEDPERTTFLEYLTAPKYKFSLSERLASTISHALCLTTSSEDLALPTLTRLRTTLHSTGIYGPSPFLVGHYGGIGDLIGGFSRVCAVWGGGQILGRALGEIRREVKVGVRAGVGAGGAGEEGGAAKGTHNEDETALGIPIYLDGPDEPADVFTADSIVCSPSHFSVLVPSTSPSSEEEQVAEGVEGVLILTSPIPFPRSGEEDEEGKETTSTDLLVFPPKMFREELGTMTVLQTGTETGSCPKGYYVVYISAPLLSPSSIATISATNLLKPYITSLLSLFPASASPLLLSSTRLRRTPPSPPSILPPNFKPVPLLQSRGESSSLISKVDEASLVAEELFWEIVGGKEKAREDGVEFFPKEDNGTSEDD
ncbi:FAD/NAD(P)-binding domain-containing protein [Meredithblackwellia eburnea MCA 4105]